ncbi:hypothetical protein [uncultured Dokdonia sp.]|uniref:hypothetical protein n=1 Tax=uncultured Dokdonia sp. TaxID=575653 RepID=UPI00262F3969|nr:hypothetical protein [uncultured Dokdonia sp.]
MAEDQMIANASLTPSYPASSTGKAVQVSIQRLVIHLFNRSLHQSKLFPNVSKDYRLLWKSITQ